MIQRTWVFECNRIREYVRSRPGREDRVSLLVSTLMIHERGLFGRQQLTILPCLLVAMAATRGYTVASSGDSKIGSKSVMTLCVFAWKRVSRSR